MAAAKLGAALRHIRGLTADPNLGEQNDGALLRAFLSHSDQAAFEVLVRRHGPMVLRVCRRTLGNASDAEDALQATFLVLARQAASIRKRESLASWLHGVAYRMATDARKAAARRHKHESRVHPTPPPDPALSAVWREMQVLLDEEIARLPETLRTPFVLCCLENHSCAEAARRLGLEEGAVGMRLSRARKRLQGRLTRRGVALTTVLAAVAVGAHGAAAAVPRPVAATIIKAAAQVGAGQALASGTVSGKVLALAEGVKQTMSLNRWKTAVLLLACTAVLGTGLGTAVLRSAAGAGPEAAPVGSNKERRPPAGAVAKPAAGEGVTVRGRVLGPDGKPVAGARLYLAPLGPIEAWIIPGGGGRNEVKRPVRATSGGDGRFAFTLTKSDQDAIRENKRLYNYELVYQVMAAAPGHGCDWAPVGPPGKGVTLRLVKDVPIRGRILDPDGKPVPGARLTVINVCAPKGDDLGGYLDSFRKGNPGPYDFARIWTGPPGGAPAVLTTGADGRFKLAGVGRERLVFLRVEGPAIATKVVEVITRTAEPVVATRRVWGRGPMAVPGARMEERRVYVYGASFDYLAVASRPVRGVVRDKDTGKPLAGVRISAWAGGSDWAAAVIDKKGRYELVGLPKSPSIRLTLRPADGLSFERGEVLDDAPGFEPLKGDVEMMGGGVTVRGKVTDKAGKPVAKARVEYRPLFPNKYINFKLVGKGNRIHSTAFTGPDGSYVLTVLPGPGVIGVAAARRDEYMPAFVSRKELKEFFKTPLIHKSSTMIAPGEEYQFLVEALPPNLLPRAFRQADYNALVLLEPDGKEKTLVRGVRLQAPLEVKGRVVGPDGQPLSGAAVIGLGRDYPRYQILKGSEFTVRGLNPRAKSRSLVFHHKDKGLGFFLKNVPHGKAGPVTVKLQPYGSASGRIVNRDGKPAAGMPLRFSAMGFGYDSSYGAAEATTDKEGRFRVKGLVPGVTYLLMPGRGPIAAIVAQVSVESGKQKEVGDVKLPRLLGE